MHENLAGLARAALVLSEQQRHYRRRKFFGASAGSGWLHVARHVLRAVPRSCWANVRGSSGEARSTKARAYMHESTRLCRCRLVVLLLLIS